ncbi:hypothetical protein Glove_759g19 [Diversispora epigaea]|uniref:Uncharacterized protein n=1 Tax=Diversispora epigaea TaxID=1348612 RepID=A0A397FZI5_9GLOM|nr:hypothetical protein Glove_759g19 [Diversispora epigaea]
MMPHLVIRKTNNIKAIHKKQTIQCSTIHATKSLLSSSTYSTFEISTTSSESSSLLNSLPSPSSSLTALSSSFRSSAESIHDERVTIPTFFGSNNVGKYKYDSTIFKCLPPPPYGCDRSITKRNIKIIKKKISFSEVLEFVETHHREDYDRTGLLYGNRSNNQIDVWFGGKTLANTIYNSGRIINAERVDEGDLLKIKIMKKRNEILTNGSGDIKL